MALTESEKVNCFRAAYQALQGTDADAGSLGLVSVEQLLADVLGQPRADELVRQWNGDETRKVSEKEPLRDLRELALRGLGFYFAAAGMPVDWARRHLRLFRYMPPIAASQRAADQLSRRQSSRRARDWPQALDAGNTLVAAAVLAGNSAAIFAHAAENVSILRAWQTADPTTDRKRDIEDYEWLRDHAPAVARWGAVVQQQLEGCGTLQSLNNVLR